MPPPPGSQDSRASPKRVVATLGAQVALDVPKLPRLLKLSSLESVKMSRPWKECPQKWCLWDRGTLILVAPKKQV